eukprot:2149799-Rhodomonas_salina.3
MAAHYSRQTVVAVRCPVLKQQTVPTAVCDVRYSSSVWYCLPTELAYGTRCAVEMVRVMTVDELNLDACDFFKVKPTREKNINRQNDAKTRGK